MKRNTRESSSRIKPSRCETSSCSLIWRTFVLSKMEKCFRNAMLNVDVTSVSFSSAADRFGGQQDPAAVSVALPVHQTVQGKEA